MRRVFASVIVAIASANAAADVRARDDAGNDVILARPAMRIVTLAPHAAELVFAAGAGARLVGTVRRSDHPPQARAVPVIGDVHALDLERIVALRPDLVVTWPYTTPAQVATLRRRGIAVFTTDPPTIDGIASDIERLGVLAGTSDPARGAAAAFRARFARVARATASATPVRVFYQVWDSPLFTIGGGHLISQGIRACGGQNVFESIRVPAPQVSVEAVVAARPEVIVAGADGAVRPAFLDDWRRWRDVPAVRAGRLHVVDADRLHRPGPRFVEGLEALCEAIAGAATR
jgi:iron complex transport system substrate-binding protein